MIDTSKSCSYEQQSAEIYIASIVEKWLGSSLDRNAKVILSGGVYIEPDLYSEKDKIICEIFAHIGPLKGGQKQKISQDILKMLLLEKSKATTYRKVIVVADDRVEKYLNGKSFISESVRQFEIEIKKVNLPDEMFVNVSNAQLRQTMRNI